MSGRCSVRARSAYRRMHRIGDSISRSTGCVFGCHHGRLPAAVGTAAGDQRAVGEVAAHGDRLQMPARSATAEPDGGPFGRRRR